MDDVADDLASLCVVNASSSVSCVCSTGLDGTGSCIPACHPSRMPGGVVVVGGCLSTVPGANCTVACPTPWMNGTVIGYAVCAPDLSWTVHTLARPCPPMPRACQLCPCNGTEVACAARNLSLVPAYEGGGILDLSSNRVTRLLADSCALPGTVTLVALLLYGNPMTLIAPAAFAPLTALALLCLGDMPLTAFPRGTFRALESLLVITFRWSTHRPTLSLPSTIFHTVGSLEQLEFQNVRVDPRIVFDQANNYTALHIVNCTLTTPILPLPPMPSLTTLCVWIAECGLGVADMIVYAFVKAFLAWTLC